MIEREKKLTVRKSGSNQWRGQEVGCTDKTRKGEKAPKKVTSCSSNIFHRRNSCKTFRTISSPTHPKRSEETRVSHNRGEERRNTERRKSETENGGEEREREAIAVLCVRIRGIDAIGILRRRTWFFFFLIKMVGLIFAKVLLVGLPMIAGHGKSELWSPRRKNWSPVPAI